MYCTCVACANITAAQAQNTQAQCLSIETLFVFEVFFSPLSSLFIHVIVVVVVVMLDPLARKRMRRAPLNTCSQHFRKSHAWHSSHHNAALRDIMTIRGAVATTAAEVAASTAATMALAIATLPAASTCAHTNTTAHNTETNDGRTQASYVVQCAAQSFRSACACQDLFLLFCVCVVVFFFVCVCIVVF